MNWKTLFRTKSIQSLKETSRKEGKSLSKTMGVLDLTALGIGAIIGTGISFSPVWPPPSTPDRP